MLTDDIGVVPYLLKPETLRQVARACAPAGGDARRGEHVPYEARCIGHLVRHVAALEVRIALLEGVVGDPLVRREIEALEGEEGARVRAALRGLGETNGGEDR